MVWRNCCYMSALVLKICWGKILAIKRSCVYFLCSITLRISIEWTLFMLVFIGNGVHDGIFAACQPWPRNFYRREIRVSTIIFWNCYLMNILAETNLMSVQHWVDSYFKLGWAFFGCIVVVAYLAGTDTSDGSALKLSFEWSSRMEQNKGTKCKQADTQKAQESQQ